MGTLLIPAAALAQLRVLNEANLPHSCQVQQATVTKGDGGTHTEAWATVRTYDARLTPVSRTEEVIAEAPTDVALWRVVLPAGADVTNVNRLIVSGVDAAGEQFTKTLDVLSVAGPRVTEMMRIVMGSEVES